MFALISKHKGIIIGAVVVVLLFLGYSVFVNNGSTPQTSNSLTRTNTNTSANDPSAPGKEFVTQLLAIQNIHFNTSLFADGAYTYLQDYSRDLTPQEVGRNNPFAPIGNDTAGAGFNAIATGTGAFINISDTSKSTSTAATSTVRSTTKTTPKK